MPIVRMKRRNEHQDKELPHTEVRILQQEFLPRRTQLLATIAHLRHKSSAMRLDASNRLIEKSRQMISKTELNITKVTEIQAPDLRNRTIATILEQFHYLDAESIISD